MANFTGGGNTTQDINNDETLYNDTRLFTGTEQVSALEPVNSGQKSPFLALWLASGRSNFFVIAPAAKRGTNFGIGSTSNPILVVAASSLSANIATNTQHQAVWLYQGGTRSFLRMGHTDLAIEDYTGSRRIAINNDGTLGFGTGYSTAVKLNILYTLSDLSNASASTAYNIVPNMNVTITKSTGVITVYQGIQNQFNIAAANTQNIGTVIGYDTYFASAANSTGVLTDFFHYRVSDPLLSGLTITNQYGYNVSILKAATNNYAIFINGIGTANGIGNSTFTGGLYHVAATTSLGNQTATTTDVAQIWLGIQTYTSTTNTRTVTNLAAIYIQGAPVASTNVTATNGPYSIWVAGGTSRFDGNLILRSGQNLTISATSQTVGAATLTIPDFAGANDTFAFTTLAQTISNKTLSTTTLSGTVSGTPTWNSNQAITLSTAAQPNVTSLGTLTSLTMGGTLTVGANTLSLVSSTVSGTPTWSSNQAITLSTAAQPNITSVGTLTSITTSGSITMTASASQIIPGATSFSVRNNANNATNFSVLDGGAVGMGQSGTPAAAQLLTIQNVNPTGNLGTNLVSSGGYGIALSNVGGASSGATGNTLFSVSVASYIGSTSSQNLTATLGIIGVDSYVQTMSGSSGTITGIAHYRARDAVLSGASATNQYGFYVLALTTATNNYGIFFAGNMTSGAHIASAAAINLVINALTTGAVILQSGGTEFFRANNTGVGFFAVAPVARQTSGANLTNNVTAGGVNDTIANYTDLTTYSNDAAAIRNDIYQLARQLKQVNDSLRLYGLLT